MTTAWRLAWLGLAGLWGYSVWGWSGMPEPRSVLDGYGVAGFATALLLLMAVGGRWLTKYPEHVNLPGKDRVLALPERYQGPFRHLVGELFGWVALEMLLIFGLVQLSILREARGQSTEVVVVAIIGVAVMSSPILLALISLRTQKVVQEAVSRARAEGAVADPDRTD